eukprot:TRINITY_DN19978_c0_g1_i1.p1 TRINITY_DN19978_c0_g1~~TRINITY_DN19978_c0_g1_i1.p1  ORF type:complete len:209 (-),score=6.24 TRINITY_DN19978_c0_g1_i1:5-631(-)
MSARICAKCQSPVSPNEPAILAENTYFHLKHFTCDECNTELGTGPYKIFNGKFYCSNDYLLLFATLCDYCHAPIKDGGISFGSLSYHMHHFLCECCSQPLLLNKLKDHATLIAQLKATCVFSNKQIYHKGCFSTNSKPSNPLPANSSSIDQFCKVCKQRCNEDLYTVGNKTYHGECLACELSLIHISEPTRPLYISYAVFCLKKKKIK